MEAFIALESLLEYFVFSTADTQQHEDDLIAHSKVSKGEALASKGKYSPKFYASIHPATFTFIIFLFFFYLTVISHGCIVLFFCPQYLTNIISPYACCRYSQPVARFPTEALVLVLVLVLVDALVLAPVEVLVEGLVEVLSPQK